MTALVTPAREHLPHYVDALQRGWSPETMRPQAAAEHLDAIGRNPAAFLARCDDPEGRGPPVTLPDGTLARRLPGVIRWIWVDGDFAGTISLRWQPGTTDLPAHVLGHGGYSVVPWHRGKGIATQALALMLPEAHRRGLAHIQLTVDADNLPSQAVILRNGGVLIERFRKPEAYGSGEALRFCIML